MSKTRFAHIKSGTKSKKPLAILITGILVVTALVGSVFAWTDFTQSQTNRFKGTFEADVTLHDEFDGLNKDVFVENTGESTIYVRVRLDEFMMVGKTQFDPDANVRDKTTWTPHTYDGTSIIDCTHAADGKFHDHYEWTMSGAQRDYRPGVPGMVYTTLGPDGKVDLTGPYKTAAPAAPVLMSEYVSLKALVDAGQNPATWSVEVKTKWDGIQNGCWILDDTATASNGGGWAYWSRPLRPAVYGADGNVTTPGQATNLLLDEVKLIRDGQDDWIYRIDVKLQAVTLNDTGKWHDPASTCGYKVTPDAQKLFDSWKS